MHRKKIIIAQISLHYESRPTIIHEWTREKYARELNRKNNGKEYQEWYFKRITARTALKIKSEQYSIYLKNQYSKAIQEKYNVGSEWQQNRWFVEEVRPTL